MVKIFGKKRVDMSVEEHNELCIYLNEWLGIWNSLPREIKAKGSWDQAKLVSDTLSDLLNIDATKAGL